MKLVENEFIKFMEKFDENPFRIILEDGEHMIGDGEPVFTVKINKVPKMTDMLTSTSITLGEAYMNGDIEIEGDLYTALNMFLGQMGKFSTDKKKLKNIIFTSKSKANQKKEVSSHYDIGNDFYKMWLDETLSYSCGYFKNDNDTLYQAQCNKVDRILEKLNLSENMTLCDIGCGWGFLLIEAAKNRDLPKLNKKFDRVVSVGMIEHVGRGNYEEFMQCVKSVLKPGGIFVLHFISSLKEYPGDAWVKKYIFPGGVIPSLREIIQIAGEQRFYTVDVESLRRHYNRTLLCWNENFQKHRAEVVEMFDEKFARMWELYLCACAATFMNGIIDLHQIVFTNDVNNELPMTRWY